MLITQLHITSVWLYFYTSLHIHSSANISNTSSVYQALHSISYSQQWDSTKKYLVHWKKKKTTTPPRQWNGNMNQNLKLQCCWSLFLKSYICKTINLSILGLQMAYLTLFKMTVSSINKVFNIYIKKNKYLIMLLF